MTLLVGSIFHMTRKIVSEMTYNVSMGTLNPTIPYHTWRHQLKTHLLKSHNEGAWLICHICQKKFSHSGQLKDHLRRHKGVKPFVCSECPKRFCSASDLKSHQPVHLDVKQFCCGKCGKDFARKHTVKRHFNRCSGSVNV